MKKEELKKLLKENLTVEASVNTYWRTTRVVIRFGDEIVASTEEDF